jgi:hypothetical protein
MLFSLLAHKNTPSFLMVEGVLVFELLNGCNFEYFTIR